MRVLHSFMQLEDKVNKYALFLLKFVTGIIIIYIIIAFISWIDFGVLKIHKNYAEAIVAPEREYPDVYPNGFKRCNKYVKDVRIASFKYFGLDYPYWNSVGQLQQESLCRADATSFDKGKGIVQFMNTTQEYIEQDIGKFDAYNPKQAINVQAYYLHKLHKQNFHPEKKLWVTYMFYNSGTGTVKKEYKRAGVADWETMKNACRRNVITLPSGVKLDFCVVGYNYPHQVYNYGLPYEVFESTTYRYW